MLVRKQCSFLRYLNSSLVYCLIDGVFVIRVLQLLLTILYIVNIGRHVLTHCPGEKVGETGHTSTDRIVEKLLKSKRILGVRGVESSPFKEIFDTMNIDKGEAPSFEAANM